MLLSICSPLDALTTSNRLNYDRRPLFTGALYPFFNAYSTVPRDARLHSPSHGSTFTSAESYTTCVLSLSALPVLSVVFSRHSSPSTSLPILHLLPPLISFHPSSSPIPHLSSVFFHPSSPLTRPQPQPQHLYIILRKPVSETEHVVRRLALAPLDQPCDAALLLGRKRIYIQTLPISDAVSDFCLRPSLLPVRQTLNCVSISTLFLSQPHVYFNPCVYPNAVSIQPPNPGPPPSETRTNLRSQDKRRVSVRPLCDNVCDIRGSFYVVATPSRAHASASAYSHFQIPLPLSPFLPSTTDRILVIVVPLCRITAEKASEG